MSTATDARRCGFTLLELLVGIVIVALLMSLLLPAVQSGRAAAQRLRCSARLAQVSLASLNYESQHGALPTASYPGPSLHHLRLAPYLELANDLVSPWQQQKPATTVLTCPSDTMADGSDQHANYLFNGGTGRGRPDGVVPGEGSIRLVAISDGLSNTALLSELLITPSSDHRTGAPDVRSLVSAGSPRLPVSVRSPVGLVLLTEPDSLLDACRSEETIPYFGRTWINRDWAIEATYDHFMTPNRPPCLAYGGEIPAIDFTAASSLGSRPASSLHAGGVNVAYGDGRVKFVSDTIDHDVWRAAGTRAGGE